MELKFITNKNHIAGYTIANYKSNRFVENVPEEYKNSIREFQNYAWDLDQEMSIFVDGRNNIIQHKLINSKIDINKKIDEYFKEVVGSKQFSIIYDQTIKSAKLCKAEWNKNKSLVTEYLESIGIQIEEDFEVFISHPGLKAGSYLGNNKISWSYQNLYPNYNTVYLTHEALHSFFVKNETTHALIEIITDINLQKLLNGKLSAKYTGHPFLEQEVNRIKPIWEKYIKSEKKDIKNFVSKIQSKH